MTDHLDDDDRDDPQEIDLDDEDDDADHADEDTVECMRCGGAVYWSVVRCPHCGEWLTPGGSIAAARSRRWAWPILVAILIAVILVVWHGLGR